MEALHGPALLSRHFWQAVAGKFNDTGPDTNLLDFAVALCSSVSSIGLAGKLQLPGLDLFKWFEFNAFNAAAVVQEARLVKGCEINYVAVIP